MAGVATHCYSLLSVGATTIMGIVSADNSAHHAVVQQLPHNMEGLPSTCAPLILQVVTCQGLAFTLVTGRGKRTCGKIGKGTPTKRHLPREVSLFWCPFAGLSHLGASLC